jgi:hypothetical protein
MKSFHERVKTSRRGLQSKKQKKKEKKSSRRKKNETMQWERALKAGSERVVATSSQPQRRGQEIRTGEGWTTLVSRYHGKDQPQPPYTETRFTTFTTQPE